MAEQKERKLNQLERNLPEGLLVDASWLQSHGYSTSLRRQYVTAGWLTQPARRVYRRRRGELAWQQVVISLQTLLDCAIIVGGRTSIELQGHAHYIPHAQGTIHLYGRTAPPNWLYELPTEAKFVFHNDRKLFRNEPITRGLTSLAWKIESNSAARGDHDGITFQSWGEWNWPLTLSTLERAVLELLDELPDRESFHQIDKLIEGMTTLSPRRLQKLLEDCTNVKVKRLFFFFADRHQHVWLKRLDRSKIDLGKGKRMLVKGGKFDRTYQITVPGDLDGVQ